MRIDNQNFTLANKASQKNPVFVVEIAFDSSNTDLHYFTSKPVTGLVGNVVDSCVKSLSGTSQKLNPSKAVSTIGSMAFSVVDKGLTALQKTKLDAGFGLKGKRVRFYVGDTSLSWSDYILTQTQIIESVAYKDLAYSFKCADVQREMRKDIFDVKKVRLSQTAAANASTIQVYTTDGFELVQQPASPSGITDAPGQKVGYLKMPNGCVVRYTGKTANTFTGCVWGRFNTAHLIEDVEKPDDATRDNAPEVEEYIYLEMPACMALYAILTGSLYNDPGENLPEHWHLGIDATYIRTSDFLFIGDDLWNVSNNDDGVSAVIKGVEKTDGKKFCEEQLLLMLGCFSPVYANGELGLKRMTLINNVGGHERELNNTNIVTYGELRHDMKSVVNQIIIHWNYVPDEKKYSRKNILLDTGSINTHGESDVLELKFRALEGSRHSYTTLKNQFDTLRDRYAGPPLLLDLTLLSSQNDLEVGDIVRVNLDEVRDYTGDTVSLDRNFEVQQVSTDWKTGRVRVSLFGSSQPASALPAETNGAALPNSWYSSSGTEINATNFPGAVTSAGGLTRITSNITLSGNTNLRNGVFYCTEDLTIDLGVTVTITENVQLRVAGFFQNNGTIDGAGNGPSGGTGTADNGNAANNGTSAGIGYTLSQDGIYNRREYKYSAGRSPTYKGSESRISLGNNRPAAARGKNSSAPYLNLITTTTTLKGIPTDIRGTSGPAGGSVHTYDPGGEGNPQGSSYVAGGDGGDGGAGLMVVARGMDMGANSQIDLSGTNGAQGALKAGFQTSLPMYSGAGGGGYCGALYVVLDGAAATAPTLNSTNVTQVPGRTIETSGISPVVVSIPISEGNYEQAFPFGISASKRGAARSTENTYKANARIQFLTGQIDAEPDYSGYANNPTALNLTESTNTPKSANADLSTIEASVTAPTDDNYKYSFIEYREQGQTGWFAVGPASPEAVFTVRSDGKTYEVSARSVSKGGKISSKRLTDTITVTDVVSLPDPVVVDVVAPFTAVTVELEDGGTVFTGRDAKFFWDNANRSNLYFKHYKVEIINTSAVVVRTETASVEHYVYTYEKNLEDSVGRSFSIRVTPISRVETSSGDYAGPQTTLAVSNAAPALPTALSMVPGYALINIYGNVPSDLDYTKVKVYCDTSTLFTPGPTNLVAESAGFPIAVSQLNDTTPLTGGNDYYLRLEVYDQFGAGAMSSEFSVTTLGDPVIDQIPVNETLTVDGKIIADASPDPYSVTLGPHIIGSDAALFSFLNNTTPVAAMYEDGRVRFGDSGEKYFQFDTAAGTLELGEEVKFKSVNTYYDEGATYDEVFLSSGMANLTTNGIGSTGDAAVLSDPAGGSFKYAIVQRRTGLNIPDSARIDGSKHKIYFKTYFKLKYDGSRCSATIGTGTTDELKSTTGAVFLFNTNGTISVETKEQLTGASHVTTQATAATWANETVMTLEIIHTPGVDVKFYKDETLIATVTTTIPNYFLDSDFECYVTSQDATFGAIGYINSYKLMFYAP